MSEDVGSGQYIDLLFGTRNLKDKCIIPSKIDLALNFPFEGVIGSEYATVLGDGSALSGVASSAAELSVDFLAGASYTKMQDMINITQGDGVISGGTITDNTDGSVTVAAGSGICKTTDTDIGLTRFIDWAENNSVGLSAGINYVFINYNAGSPVVYVNTDITLWWSFDHIFLGTIWKENSTLHIINAGIQMNSLSSRVIRRIYEKYGVDHASGALIGSTGTRNITLSAGLFYVGLSRQTSPAFDTSGTDTFSYWWRDGIGGWTELEDQTQIENIHYDDGTGAGNGYPAGIISSKNYGVHWVYLNFDGSCIHVVYGQGDYTASGADDALPPVSLPDVLADYSFLVGKIIVEETQDTLFTFSPFVVAFVGSFVANHNELAGLQGGIADEYFHLTEASHDIVTGLGTKYVDLPPEGWSRPIANGAELYQVGDGTNNLVWNELRFALNVDNYAQRLYKMPANYNGGNITVKMISKTPYDGSVTPVVAKLILAGIGRTVGETFDPATGWVSNSQDLTVNLGAELPYLTTFALTIAGEVVAGDILILKIQRDGNDAGDTLEDVLKSLDFELSFGRA